MNNDPKNKITLNEVATKETKMGSVVDRIETSSIGVDFITLSDAESEHYRGAGDAVAYFNDAGEITGIDYIHDVP